jgi:hypothetical protein
MDRAIAFAVPLNGSVRNGMTSAVFKVLDAGTYAEIVRAKLPFSQLENGAVVVRSQLGAEVPLNDHLVWLWGMLQGERRVLKNAVSGGARLVCQCQVARGEVRIQPNGAEMLHLLGAELVLEAG